MACGSEPQLFYILKAALDNNDLTNEQVTIWLDENIKTSILFLKNASKKIKL